MGFLSHREYIVDVLEDTGMIGCKSTSSPMISNLKLMANFGELVKDLSMYRSSHLLNQYQIYDLWLGELINLCTNPMDSFGCTVSHFAIVFPWICVNLYNRSSVGGL